MIYEKEGIEIGRNHFRNDQYTIFKKFKFSCPMMDELEHKYFFVPHHYGVTETMAHKIGGIFLNSKLNLKLNYEPNQVSRPVKII